MLTQPHFFVHSNKSTLMVYIFLEIATQMVLQEMMFGTLTLPLAPHIHISTMFLAIMLLELIGVSYWRVS